MSNHRRCFDDVIRNHPCGDPMQLLEFLGGPHLGSQQSQAHLNQRVVQVNQNHVLAAFCKLMVEDDWASLALRFAGNRSAMVELGTITGVARPKWRILGTRGAIWGDWGLESISVVTYAGGVVVTEKVPIGPAAWEDFYADVADHLLTGSAPAVTPESAIRVIAVIQAAERSARTGKAVASRI